MDALSRMDRLRFCCIAQGTMSNPLGETMMEDEMNKYIYIKMSICVCVRVCMYV